MRFTSQEEYGLRCMIQLARGEDNGPVSIEEISRNEGITTSYVGKLMRILMKGGLVESTRGKMGGYVLTKPAAQMSVNDVLTVLGGRLFEQDDHCTKFTGQEFNCVNSTDCSVRALWSTLDRVVSNVLSNTMLKDLVVGERKVSEWLRYGVKMKADKDRTENSTTLSGMGI